MEEVDMVSADEVRWLDRDLHDVGMEMRELVVVLGARADRWRWLETVEEWRAVAPATLLDARDRLLVVARTLDGLRRLVAASGGNEGRRSARIPRTRNFADTCRG